MSHKSEICYKAVFTFIQKTVFKLEPAEVITDFEAGLSNAIKNCYPNIRLRGCWYHICAALRKKRMKLGLHTLLKLSQYARAIKKMLMSLPLLPAEHFEEGYKHIKDCANRWNVSSDFKEMFAYYESYWFNQVQNEICLLYLYKHYFPYPFPFHFVCFRFIPYVYELTEFVRIRNGNGWVRAMTIIRNINQISFNDFSYFFRIKKVRCRFPIQICEPLHPWSR